MSFIDKIKLWFNIGAFNVDFEMDRAFHKHQGELKGHLKLSSEGERKIKKIYISLDQHIKKTDMSGNEHMEIVTIGKTTYDFNDVLKANEPKTLDFNLRYTPRENLGDKIAGAVAKQDGVLGMIGSIGATLRNLEVTYTLKVKPEIEGALFKPEETVGVKLM